jgi:hypothetical protein
MSFTTSNNNNKANNASEWRKMLSTCVLVWVQADENDGQTKDAQVRGVSLYQSN